MSPETSDPGAASPSPPALGSDLRLETLGAYTAGLRDGHSIAIVDTERRISNARSDGFAAGRTWTADTTSKRSPAVIAMYLLAAYLFGFYVLGPFVSAVLDRHWKDDTL